MLDWLRGLFGYGSVEHRREHAWMLEAMTEQERRLLEAEAMAAELEARVALLESEHADDRLA
jgi:hypothetical protein